MTVEEIRGISKTREILQKQIDLYGQEYDAEGIEALKKAIKVLEQTSWIPVGDALPKEDENVMATVEINGHRLTTTTLYFSGSSFWNDYVVAWMPLLEPYKAESEE